MPAKKRCEFQSSETRCNQAVLRIVGQCPHCRLQFCGEVRLLPIVSPLLWLTVAAPLQHRMPEHHECQNLESCRQQAFEKNKAKLESERTVASKMAAA